MLYRISVTERGLTGIANIFRSRLSRLDDLLGAGTVPLTNANYKKEGRKGCIFPLQSNETLCLKQAPSSQQQRTTIGRSMSHFELMATHHRGMHSMLCYDYSTNAGDMLG